MLAVVEHYERAGIVDRLDGTQSIEAVTNVIVASIGARAAR